MPALEDVPDASEEMHGPSAVGDPTSGRVEPVVRPAQADTKRPAEEGISAKAKKSKPETPRGVKRDVMDQTLQDLYDEEKAKLRQSKTQKKTEPASSSSSRPSSAPASALELAALLESKVFPGQESLPKKEILEISQLICSLGVSKSDVAEIYNPKRFVSRANEFGLRPGFAVDLSIQKNNKGDYWDLSRAEDQRELKAIQRKTRPLFLVGSPPCGPFSPLQNLSKHKRTEEENEAILAEGRMHLKVACEAYEEQHRKGRFFLHEHPKPSASWQEKCIQRVQELDGVFTVQAPMCKWHMVSEDGQGIGYVKKETQWVTNSWEVAQAIEGKCEGGHRHVRLVNGRARYAQVYPPKLVSAILKGIRQELRNAGELSALAETVAGPSPDDTNNNPTEPFFNPDDVKGDEIWDSVTGTLLDPVKVWEAREEEMKWVKKQQLWDVVDESLCWEETGKPPVTLKWVDRSKSDAVNPMYRSRLVVREIKKASKPLEEHESYSAMPPLEALKALLSIMTSKRVSTKGKRYKLALIDISRAHFYGASKRRVFCALPQGQEQPGKCALLRRTMYGTLDAAHIWQETYTEWLKECGIRQCIGWPALYMHDELDLRFLVHGDDFVALGDEDALKFLEKKLKEKFELRVDGLIGPDATDGTSMSVLNRIISYNKADGVVSYEADARHAEQIVKELDLTNAKAVTTPSEKQRQEDVLDAEDLPVLSPEEASKYRSLVMRAAYLSLDRADIAEMVKGLARHMKAPTSYSWGRLKRLGRYLLGKPRVCQVFRPQRMFSEIRVFCDSDHAGDLATRKSTTGLVVMLGDHNLKCSSTLQSTISLSSGESEYYALVKAAQTGLGVSALLTEWKIPVKLVLLSDSSAASGMISRKGLGRTRHVQTRYLWVQERIRVKDLRVEVVGTEKNVSDIGTKPLPAETVLRHMTKIGQLFTAGRHEKAKLLV